MSLDAIEFIGVSHHELKAMPIKELEIKIEQNIRPHFEKISSMSLDQLIDMREEVKDTRKQKFRFSQEITSDISKERIQIALTYLAKLFRKLDDQIKKILRCQ